MCGEFVGTVLFLWMALGGTQVANNIPSSAGLTVAQTGANPQQLQYIALSFGFSLSVNAWIFFRISGGLFNPAVTIGMCLIGALPWVRGALLFVTQVRWNHSWVSVYRPTDVLSADHRRHGGSSTRVVYVSRTFERYYETRRRHLDCTGALYRNVLDRATGLHNLHAGRGKAQGHIPRASRHWPVVVHR